MGETAGGVLRRGSDRILGGVCSGLAEYFRVDPLLVRIVFVILTLNPLLIGALLYAVLWFLMDPPAGSGLPASRSAGERLRMMGDELGEVFRGNVRRMSAPRQGSPLPDPPPQAGEGQSSGAPPPPHRPGWEPGSGRRPAALWAGVILIVLGAYFLLVNLGVLSAFRPDLFWPIVLIAAGLLLLARRR